LKLCYHLIVAGKMIIDLGTGNPIGLLSTGITALKDIYETVKFKDDDEFQALVSNAFLTSAEQDALLMKLRKKGFFNKMAYDRQIGGWYLLHPEIDGNEPPVVKKQEVEGKKQAQELKNDIKVDMETGILATLGENKSTSDSPEEQSQMDKPITLEEPSELKIPTPTDMPAESSLMNELSCSDPLICHFKVRMTSLESNFQSEVSKSVLQSTAFVYSPKSRVQKPVQLCRVEGFMTKKGSFFPSWKRRYFILENRVLTYYKTEQDALENNRVGTPFVFSPPRTGCTNEGLTIKLQNYMKNRILLLRLDNESDVAIWKEAFEEHKSRDIQLSLKERLHSKK